MQLASALPLQGYVAEPQVFPFPHGKQLDVAPASRSRELGGGSAAKASRACSGLKIRQPRPPLFFLDSKTSGLAQGGELTQLGAAAVCDCDHGVDPQRTIDEIDGEDKLFYRRQLHLRRQSQDPR